MLDTCDVQNKTVSAGWAVLSANDHVTDCCELNVCRRIVCGSVVVVYLIQPMQTVSLELLQQQSYIVCAQSRYCIVSVVIELMFVRLFFVIMQNFKLASVIQLYVIYIMQPTKKPLVLFTKTSKVANKFPSNFTSMLFNLV